MNLEKYRNRHGQIWLNVASGNYFQKDFVNLDSNFLVWLSPFYPLIKNLLKPNGREWLRVFREGLASGHLFKYANCARPPAFPANSVDHILTSHFLEHLYPETVARVLDGFHRVLKPDGTLHVIVPDLEIRARRYLEKFGAAEAANEFVTSLYLRLSPMPHWVNRFLQALNLGNPEHCWMYDRHSLLDLLQRHGFALLDRNDSPSASWRLAEWGQVNVLARKS